MQNESILGKRIREEPLDIKEAKPEHKWYCRDFAWEEPHHKSNGNREKDECEDDESSIYTDDEPNIYTYEEEYIANQLYNDGVDIDAYYAMLDRDLDDPLFKPDEEMEKLDEDLRVAYETQFAYLDDGPRLTREDDAHEDWDQVEEQDIKFVEEQDPIYENKLIKKYEETLNISATEAFELLRRCHYCGTSNMKFGDSYCGPRCQEYHFDFDYPCYWNQERWQNQCANNCIMCNWNDYYKNPAYDM